MSITLEAEEQIEFAVNGTLMKGLELNRNLLAVNATFKFETLTEPNYRLWSIDDVHPAMIRVSEGGKAIAVEIWSVPQKDLVQILVQEPPGLTIGKVKLINGETVLGVLAEPILCEGKQEITSYGGWRAYKFASVNVSEATTN